MRHFGEPFRRQAAHIISALVWRTVEERRYEITQEGEQQQMEVFPAYATPGIYQDRFQCLQQG